jgi:DNA-binding NarL/FixJ family response regulator
MNPKTLGVVVVDDEEAMRNAVSALLEETESVRVLGTGADGVEGVGLVLKNHPDVVLMDLRMPVMDGVEATRRLSREIPEIPVLIHSAYGDESLVIDALQAGARGYVLKGSPASDLVMALTSVAAGHAHLSDEITRPLVERLVTALRLERETRIAAEETAERLSQLNARQREFAAQAAHELRSPLTSLLGHLELLVEASRMNQQDVVTAGPHRAVRRSPAQRASSEPGSDGAPRHPRVDSASGAPDRFVKAGRGGGRLGER